MLFAGPADVFMHVYPDVQAMAAAPHLPPLLFPTKRRLSHSRIATHLLPWPPPPCRRPYADADVPVYILMMSLGNGSLKLPPLREEATTPGLVRLVERCMAWLPADRPSFREVLHMLENEYKVGGCVSGLALVCALVAGRSLNVLATLGEGLEGDGAGCTCWRTSTR